MSDYEVHDYLTEDLLPFVRDLRTLENHTCTYVCLGEPCNHEKTALNQHDAAIRADERRKIEAELTALMEEAGEAMFNDTQFRGANSFEASTGLQAVADALGIPGPDRVYDRLCGGANA